jgi:hypothetical protein
MPFSVHNFLENVECRTKGKARENLRRLCAKYVDLTTAKQRASCIKEMMDLLDESLNANAREAVMEACGRQCICKSVIEKALRIQKKSHDLDDLLQRLNQAHIGGGHLTRKGKAIHATYDRCYCGSVSKSAEKFSPTYCYCSCGWYRELFETLTGKPVEVKLLSSIVQGDECCRFQIRF